MSDDEPLVLGKADALNGTWIAQLTQSHARIKELEALVREMSNTLLLSGYVFAKIKNEGFQPKQKMLDEIQEILNRPLVKEIMESE